MGYFEVAVRITRRVCTVHQYTEDLPVDQPLISEAKEMTDAIAPCSGSMSCAEAMWI